MVEENGQRKGITRLIGILALFKLVLAIFAWWGRDPDQIVKWGELRWVFLIEFLFLAYLLWKIHFYNWARFG